LEPCEPIILIAVGREAEANAALTELIRDLTDKWPTAIAQAYANRSDIGRTIGWLDRTYRQKDPEILRIIDEALFIRVVDDPRFQGFVRES
jgi:hypothetical protein